MTRSFLFTALFLLALPLGLYAQTGVVSGRVLDATSSQPLPDATVTLEPAQGGALPGRSQEILATRNAATNEAGEYTFTGVTPGGYRLHVQRLGYRSRSVELEVRASESRISVGLEVEPVALEPVHVSTTAAAQPGEAYARHARGYRLEGERRIAAERLRQRSFLSSDVRAITHADVTEGVTLGESDLFRALQRMPGVSSADEYSAELWTRGAPWDQTRVFFDRLPVFNGLHALGIFSAVNPDALGAAFLHPGAQPVEYSGGAAGVLDLRTRRGTGDELRGLGELSLASARASLERGGENGAWLVAARRSWLDLATRAAELVVDERTRIPYRFWDVATRVDRRLTSSLSIDASALVNADHIAGDIPDVLHNTDARWGSQLAQVTLTDAKENRILRQTFGFSLYGSRVRNIPPDPDNEYSAPSAPPSQNSLRYFNVAGEIATGTSVRPGLRAGYDVVLQMLDFDGTRPVGYDPAIPPPQLEVDASHSMLGVWVTNRWQRTRVSVDAGMRVDAGSTTSNAGPLRVRPQAAARIDLGGGTTASVAYSRAFQYAQALASTGVAPVKGFTSDPFWLLANDTIPAIRSDVVTAGIERWLGTQWLAGITGYARRATGVAIPDPAPGNLLDRALWVSAENHARGAELSLRKLSGRWTASLAYTYGTSRMEYDSFEFASPADQRHNVDATYSWRATTHWRLGAAVSAGSGLPYTRRFNGEALCTGPNDCRWQTPPSQEAPYAQRRTPVQSVDLLAEWQREYGSWNVSAFLQVRNTLNHENQGRYVGAETICNLRCGTGPDGIPFGFTVHDEFLPSMPVLPLIGMRVAF